MPTKDTYAPGTPNWVDLGSPDPARSAAFYGGLFGWTVEEGPPEAGGYRMCLLDGRPAAGIGPAQSDGAWWTTYVAVADCDARARAVQDAGGSVVVDPMDVMDVGRMAVCLDPRGAAFSLWQAGSHDGAGIVNEHGAHLWSELATRDVAAECRFYPAVFGWGYDQLPNGEGTYTTFSVEGEAVGGIMQIGDEMPAEVPDHWMVYFASDDPDATTARARELGGTVTMEPFDVPGVGRIGILNGPDGEIFSVMRGDPATT
jgi:predicted enzyme related to lactoylglutathione lyase